jgi:hypothetical protein
MSAEPAAVVATATEPVPGAEEQKVEAVEAPSQPQKAPAPEVPAPEEKKTEAPEAPVAPAQTEPASVEATEKPASPPSSPLSKLFAELPSIVEAVQYTEMWGVQLTNSSDIPSSIVLEKFLRANNQDVAKAKAQLAEALLWRKEVQPQKRLAETEFSESKFGGLGYVTVYPKTESHEKEIVTWNIYGAVKDKQETFGNAEEYVSV